MFNKKRVLFITFLLYSFLQLISANDWVVSRQNYRTRNDTRFLTHNAQRFIATAKPIHQNGSLFQRHPLLATVICVLVIFMIICTLVGNAMVCLAVCLVRKLKAQPANLLLVSLAVADFCVGLIVMPIALLTITHDEWLLGNAVCALWTTADLMLCTASITNLCLISVDRYLAVTQPLTYCANRTRKRIFCYILIVWVCALLVSTTPLIVFPIHRTEGSCEVSQNQLYQIYATVLSFYAPCLIMVILYWRMWKAAKALQQRDTIANKWSLSQPEETDNNHNGQNNQNGNTLGANLNPIKNGLGNGNACSTNSLMENSPRRLMHRPSSILHAIRIHSNSKNHEKTEDKARKTLGVIMAVFITCWLPFFILALLKSLNIIDVAPWLDLLVLWLGYSNSMLNPLLYCKYNREFRIPFREMLCCRFSTLQSVMRNESFVTKFGPPRMNELRNSTASMAAVLAIPNVPSSKPVTFSLNGDTSSDKMNGVSKTNNLEINLPKIHIDSL